MEFQDVVFLLLISCAIHIPVTHQLQNYQIQVLLQLRKHLEYPSQLTGWDSYTGDFCGINLSPAATVSCQDNAITGLQITGDKHANGGGVHFSGFPIPGETLSERFSVDTFVTTLTRLPSLRIVSLVALGIWGPLPDKIHRLSFLEVLDLSSNYIYGAVPPQLSLMSRLQTLTLNSNFLNGTVPDWFDSSSNLTGLSLKNNQLTGHFPPSICEVATLTGLSLSQNKLYGHLPDLSGLYRLHLLDLRENNFDSALPSMPSGLITALLSNNSFSGDIPDQFGELSQLQHLDLSFNLLTGKPPDALFSLPNISYLNLASNLLSGSLPDHLECGEELGFIDISANKLTGGLPSCLEEAFSGKRVVKFGGNCLNVDKKNQKEESNCQEKKSFKVLFWNKGRMLLIGVVVGFTVLLILLVLVSLALVRMHSAGHSHKDHKQPRIIQENPQPVLSAELLANARLISQAAKAAAQGAPAYKVFYLEELEEATNNFDVSTFLGQGSIGKVYKGKLGNGTEVAIRSVCLYRKYTVQGLKIRLDHIAKLHHPHLVTLLGHCVDYCGQDQSTASRIFFIYEYMPNGNFRAHLSGSSPQRVLRWSDRLAVLIDIAKAVHFLHTGVIPGCFSNRLRTNSILLDDNHVAKLSDYGMSIITDDVDSTEGKLEGSKLWQMKRREDDVYYFGFILLEALVGPVVTGKGEAFLLNEMTSFGSQDGRKKMVDPIVLTTSCEESLSRTISITNKCVSPDPTIRPSFEDVLWNLQYAAQVQASADAEQKALLDAA